MAGTTARRRKGRTSPGMVFYFGATRTDGSAGQRDLLGGKGANLAEMTTIGLPVPPGCTLTTDTCAAFLKAGGVMPRALMPDVRRMLDLLAKETGRSFGDRACPLLLSVRSGAAVSMPGMMDTILNLGLNDTTLEGLASLSGERFALDAYRRLISMFGDVVMGVDHHRFEHEFDRLKKSLGAETDTEVDEAGLRTLCTRYKKIYRDAVGSPFPQDPMQQLQQAIGAVFHSWNTDRARTYRRVEGISGLRGTAVNVQAMVFGNMGPDSGTGVAFTRDPSTGKNRLYGEFLINAQGEDVVAGTRTPMPVSGMSRWQPGPYAQLLEVRSILEKHYQDMQDLEFTIEEGRLYILQTRSGKRTGAAAAKIAVDMVKEKLIDRETALQRISGGHVTQMLLPSFTAQAKSAHAVLTVGLPASPGAAVGSIAFSAEEAVRRSAAGERVLLVRRETSPEDIDGMECAEGILTSTGGMTSHAAVVARGWGTCCVAGAGEITVDARKRTLAIGSRILTHRDVLSIDGSTGEVLEGAVDVEMPRGITGNLRTILSWADDVRSLGVRANADTPEDARRARDLGAAGIGLTRTEHMFFEGDRIQDMRRMILAEDVEERCAALHHLLPYQKKDFIGILTAMKGLPVTIRLLDPPLHEFLPHEQAAQQDLARRLSLPVRKIRERVEALRESNPMLGHRGCRLAVSYPEILEMQVRAITEAMIHCRRRRIDARPEIMIPLIGTARELSILRCRTEETIAAVIADTGFSGKVEIPIGTMIEIPRAALTADEIAASADFFSFGTNDLTQLCFGYSRDDAGSFLPAYIAEGILAGDPFESLDSAGVGKLVETACRLGRQARKDLKLGICGEHAGDPASIDFCHAVGLDYVSCSPFRVPIARLEAARAVITRR